MKELKKMNEIFDNGDINDILTNFVNLDTYVKYNLIYHLENDDLENIENDSNVLANTLIDSGDGTLFMFQSENEKFLGHFGMQIIMVLNEIQEECGAIKDLDINNLLLIVVEEVAERMLRDNFNEFDIKGDYLSKDDIADIIENLKELDDDSMDFISDQGCIIISKCYY